MNERSGAGAVGSLWKVFAARLSVRRDEGALKALHHYAVVLTVARADRRDSAS